MSKSFSCGALDRIEKIFTAAEAQADKARRLLRRLEEAYQAEERARREALNLREDDYNVFYEAQNEAERLEGLVAAMRTELDLEASEDIPSSIFTREISNAQELHELFNEAADLRVKALEKLKGGAREGWAAKIVEFIKGGSGSSLAEDQANSTAEGRYNSTIKNQIIVFSQNPIRVPKIKNLEALKQPLPKLADFES